MVTGHAGGGRKSPACPARPAGYAAADLPSSKRTAGSVMSPGGAQMKWRQIVVGGLVCAAVAGVILWVLHARLVGHWLQVHTGTVNEPGPYYGFWSGFGSDIAEFSILGAIGTGLYQLVKKVNCHEPGCWRVGTHPAAGGQFMLCYRHHPDYNGKKPTHELIERLHAEHKELQAAIHGKPGESHRHVDAVDTDKFALPETRPPGAGRASPRRRRAGRPTG